MKINRQTYTLFPHAGKHADDKESYPLPDDLEVYQEIQIQVYEGQEGQMLHQIHRSHLFRWDGAKVKLRIRSQIVYQNKLILLKDQRLSLYRVPTGKKYSKCKEVYTKYKVNKKYKLYVKPKVVKWVLTKKLKKKCIGQIKKKLFVPCKLDKKW